jgi:hypothetical protein
MEGITMKNIKVFFVLLLSILSIISCQSYGPLNNAIRDGDITRVRTLLDKGAGINEKDKYVFYSPLMWATYYKNIDIIKLLLDRGANINEIHFDGPHATPLIMAVDLGNFDIVKLLVDRGADVNLPCGADANLYDAVDSVYFTALYIAIEKSKSQEENYNEIIRLLLNKGAIVYRKHIEASIYNKGMDEETLRKLKEAYTGNTITVKYNEGLLLAVIDFEPRGLPRQDSTRLSEWIRTDLINSGQFKVIERAAMNEILKEQSFSLTGCTDTSCAVQVGKLLSARKILVGTIESYNNQIFISGRIVDVEKGVAEIAHKETINSVKNLDKGASNFVKNLTKRINGIPVQ